LLLCSHRLVKKELVVVVEGAVGVDPLEVVDEEEAQLDVMEILLMVEVDLHLMIVQEV
jgi:hypothetical protein